MKWGFVLMTNYTGLFGALHHVRHAGNRWWVLMRGVAAPWRQVVGSTMHCVAGDGLGNIVAAAALAPFTSLRPWLSW